VDQWTVPATVVRVIDGDTCVVACDLGWRISVATTVRIRGVNSPERETAEGRTALGFAATLLPAGLQVVLTSYQLDKYGRTVGDITLPDGSDYAQALLAAGHAHPYNA
jgi:endonuclease YncB( thermonuclease family)